MLEVWEVVTVEPLSFALLFSTGISGGEFPTLAWSPDSIHLITSSGFDATIWNTDTGSPVEVTLEGHSPDVNTVYWQSDNQWVLTGDGHGTIRVWNPNNNYTLIRSFTNEGDFGFISAAVSPDETLIALPTLINGDDMGVWNINTGSRVDSFNVLDTLAWAIRWGKHYLAILDANNVIRILEPQHWEVIDTISPSNLVLDIAWSPDGTQLAYMEAGGTLQIISV